MTIKLLVKNDDRFDYTATVSARYLRARWVSARD
jgi:hypothetical protein